MINETKRRESLAVDAVNEAPVFLGTTLAGWLLAPPVTYAAWALSGLKAAIAVFILAWFLPPAIARSEPHLLQAVIRSLFIADYHDAD